MNYRSDWPAGTEAQAAYVRAEAAAYRAKLMAGRAASEILQTYLGPRPVGLYLFGETPDGHLARLESELRDIEWRLCRRAPQPQLGA